VVDVQVLSVMVVSDSVVVVWWCGGVVCVVIVICIDSSSISHYHLRLQLWSMTLLLSVMAAVVVIICIGSCRCCYRCHHLYWWPQRQPTCWQLQLVLVLEKNTTLNGGGRTIVERRWQTKGADKGEIPPYIFKQPAVELVSIYIYKI